LIELLFLRKSPSQKTLRPYVPLQKRQPQRPNHRANAALLQTFGYNAASLVNFIQEFCSFAL
jgi:hypothetical protein